MYSAALCTANSDSPYASALLLLDLLFSNNDVYFSTFKKSSKSGLPKRQNESI